MRLLTLLGILLITVSIIIGAFLDNRQYYWRVNEYISPSTCALVVCQTHNFNSVGTYSIDMSYISCYNKIKNDYDDGLIINQSSITLIRDILNLSDKK